MKTRMLLCTALFIGALMIPVNPLWAAWPERPIRWIVPFAAGGAVDIFCRMITPVMGRMLGQPIIVDNSTGAGGMIGTQKIGQAKPDGYVIGLAHNGPLAINFSLYKDVPYKSPDDFSLITFMGRQQNCIVVHPKSTIKSVKDLIAKAKTSPGEIKMGSGGNGTGSHLGGELFMSMAGVKFLHVPYKGNAPSVIGVLSDEVELMFPSVTSVIDHVKEGRLRIIAVTTPKRLPAFPGIPTVAEFIPSCCESVWFGLMGPAGLPEEIVNKLNETARIVLSKQEFNEKMLNMGLEIAVNTPKEFRDMVLAEKERWKKVVKEAGIQAQ